MVDRMDPATAQALFAKGALSKNFMDRVYGDLLADEAADEDNTDSLIASDIANAIKENPKAASLAQKVYEATIGTPEAQADEITPEQAKQIALGRMFDTPNQPPQAAPVAAQQQSPSFTQRVGQGVGAVGRGVANVVGAGLEGPIAGIKTLGQGAASLGQGIVSGFTGDEIQPQQAQAPAVSQAPAAVDTSEFQTMAQGDVENAKLNSTLGKPTGVLTDAEKAINMMKQGIIMQANAAQGTAGHIQGAFADAINKMESQAKDFSVRNASLMQGYDSEMKKQQDAIEQFSQEKVDGNRYWGNMSTANKIGSLLSIAISGAIGNGTNKSLDLINKAIDRDIAIQKDNLAIKQQGLEARDSFLSKINARVSSEAQAEQLTKAYMLDQIKARVEMATVQGAGAQAQAQMLKDLGELQLKSIKAAQEFAIADVNAGNVAAANGEDLPTLPEDANYLALSQKYKGQVIPNIGIARSREAATKSAGKISSYRAVKEQLDGLEKLISDYGVETLPSKARIEAKSKAKKVFLAIKSAEGFGALDKGSVEFGQGMISDDPLGQRGGALDDPLGVSSRVGNMIAGENLSLTQVREMQKQFDSQFRNNLAVDMLAISPKIRKELLSAGNSNFANKDPDAKSVGKARAP